MKVELTHDSLAAKIYDKVSAEDKNLRKVEKILKDRYDFYASGNSTALLTKDELNYISPYLSRLVLSKEEEAFIKKSRSGARRSRNMRLILIFVLLLLPLLVMTLFNINKARKNAEEQRKIAVKQQEIAEIQRNKADSARTLAQKQEAIAIKEARRADSSARVAYRQRIIADSLRIRAEKEEVYAKEQAAEAQKQGELAVKNAAEAQKQERLALENAEENRVLSVISLAQVLASKALYEEVEELSALLAQQAYNFNKQYAPDNPYDPTIYKGLAHAYNNISDKKSDLQASFGSIRSMLFNEEGNLLYTTGSDGKLRSWDMGKSGLKEIVNKDVRNDTVSRALALSQDQRWLAAGSGSPFIYLFDMMEPGKSEKIQGHQGEIYAIVALPDGSGFLSSSSDRTLRFYNGETLTQVAKTESRIKSLSISPDGRLLAGGDENGYIKLWDIRENYIEVDLNEMKDPASSSIPVVAFNRKGNTLAAGNNRGQVSIWDTEKKRLVRRLSGQNNRISSLGFSRKGDRMASGSFDGTVQLWNFAKLDDPPIVLDSHSEWVTSLAFNPKGDTLAVGYYDGKIKLWPTDARLIADEICRYLKRNMSEEEWERYIGQKIDYERTCPDLPDPNTPRGE